MESLLGQRTGFIFSAWELILFSYPEFRSGRVDWQAEAKNELLGLGKANQIRHLPIQANSPQLHRFSPTESAKRRRKGRRQGKRNN